MKSEHRHELKTNELADWIAHVPDFVRNNLRTIIGVSLIIIAILLSGNGKIIGYTPMPTNSPSAPDQIAVDE